MCIIWLVDDWIFRIKICSIPLLNWISCKVLDLSKRAAMDIQNVNHDVSTSGHLVLTSHGFLILKN